MGAGEGIDVLRALELFFPPLGVCWIEGVDFEEGERGKEEKRDGG